MADFFFLAQEKIRVLEEMFKFQQRETEMMMDKQKREYKERLNELENELAEVYRTLKNDNILKITNNFQGK